MRKVCWTLTTGTLLALFASTPETAAADIELRALGGFSNQLQNSAVEKPFFEGLQDLGFKVEFRSIDEVGLKGFDALRQLQSGIFDVMAISPGYIGGDDPFFLGLDLPAITIRLEDARKAVNAYREVFDRRLQERFNGKLLALWPYPAQVFFCNGPISGLDDLKGKKVRVFSPALASFVEYLQGTAVTLPFSEVYQSLQRGVIDCAITASLSGYTAKWFEVADHLYPLAVSWAIQGHAANWDFWSQLSADQQKALAGRFQQLEAKMWSMAQKTSADGIACNTGSGPCPYGAPAGMKLVEVSERDLDLARDAAIKVVLPRWATNCKRVYPDCDAVWNSTIGKAIGLKIQ